jgi:uroporphyrinogen III methyltransferase/synthase
LRLRERFRERGGHGIVAPALAIEPVDDGAVFDALIERLAEFDWLIFSSRSGVQHFFERLHSRQRDARSLAPCRVASVGNSTAEAMLPYGIHCDWVPQEGAGAEALLSGMAPLLRGKRVLLVRAAEGNQTLQEGLRGLAERVEETIVYQQVPVETWSIDWREWEGVDDRRAVVATSGNGARQAWKLLGQRAHQAQWLCLSPAVASALEELGATRLATSDEPSFASLVDRAEQLTDRDSGPNHAGVEREPG